MSDTPVHEYPIYALDIETDNSEGKGLDPSEAAVVSWSLVGPDRTIFQSSEIEDDLLFALVYAMHDLPDRGIVATWNGGAFDFPFLTVRMKAIGVPTLWQLADREDRQPKYEPTPPFNGVCRVLFRRDNLHHLDVAYLFDHHVADLYGTSWSLKPIAEHLKMTDSAITQLNVAGVDASMQTAPRLAAYNTHDSWITKKLADYAVGVLAAANQFGPQLDSSAA
jgi:DNA polymerase elongation subunit (family B)